MTTRRRHLGPGSILFIVALLVISLTSVPARLRNSELPSTVDLTAKEKELVAEINLMRSDPPKYAAYLEQSKKYYTGKGYKPPGQAHSLTTFEGVAAVDEAIKVLRETKPLPPQAVSPGMCMAARDHVMDLGKTGKTGHRGTDGSTPDVRVNRYGRFLGSIGENIIYETATARELVIGWLVDDGVPNRGHRKNLLSLTYGYLGVAVGAHAEFGEMCVLTFAGEYVEAKTTPPPKKPKPPVRKM